MSEVTKEDIEKIYDVINRQALTMMRIETLIVERRVWCSDCQKETVKTHLEEVRASARSIKDAVITYVVQGLVSCCFMGALLMAYNYLKG